MISIVILAHNQLASTKRCLNSVFKYTQEPYKLILINNGSNDGTKEYFESLDAVVINYEKNEGFILPNNRAMLEDNNDILLLNNDIEILQDNWLKILKERLYSDKNIGLTYPLNRTRGVSYYGGLIENKNESLLNINAPYKKPTWAQFCCVLIKRSVIDQIGLLDEQFSPGYFEDVDYCVRMIEQGYRMDCVNELTVEHYQSVTSKTLNIDHFRYKNKGKFYQKWKTKF